MKRSERAARWPRLFAGDWANGVLTGTPPLPDIHDDAHWPEWCNHHQAAIEYPVPA